MAYEKPMKPRFLTIKGERPRKATNARILQLEFDVETLKDKLEEKSRIISDMIQFNKDLRLEILQLEEHINGE